MNKAILEKFYNGHCIEAYKIFGAHPCFEGTAGVRFCVYAPNAQKVNVIGSFNQWNLEKDEMKRLDDQGFYSLFIAGAKVDDMYKYRVVQANGRIVDKMDPYAFYSELRPNTASVVANLSDMKWEDEDWILHRDCGFHKPLNIYEVHIGSWHLTEDGKWLTYREIAADLISYVKAMHFTHIEFMPLNEYPFDGSWGYQCSGYFAATSRYGTPQDLMYLINECHKAGIGVILDFVPVHFVRDDFSLSYFDGTPLYEYSNDRDANSQWGTSNFDLWREDVRSFLMSAAAFWIDQYHVDGLRMDAVSNIIHWHGNKDLGANQGAIDFIRRLNYNLHHKYKGIILIAEDSSDFPNVTKSTTDMGLGFDYKWDLGWMNDTLKYFEMDPIFRKWHHNTITFSMAYTYTENFILPFSHDEVVHGKKTIMDKLWGSYEQKFSQLRTLYMYMYTHPGKKLNFMSNEIAQVREWDEEKENDWFLLKYPVHDSFRNYFKKLNELYLNKKALHENDRNWLSFKWIDADNRDENIFSYLRTSEDSHIVVIINASGNHYAQHPFGVEHSGDYEIILNSEDTLYSGYQVVSTDKIKSKKKECDHLPNEILVDVPAFGAIMLETKIPKLKTKTKREEKIKK